MNVTIFKLLAIYLSFLPIARTRPTIFFKTFIIPGFSSVVVWVTLVVIRVVSRVIDNTARIVRVRWCLITSMFLNVVSLAVVTLFLLEVKSGISSVFCSDVFKLMVPLVCFICIALSNVVFTFSTTCTANFKSLLEIVTFVRFVFTWAYYWAWAVFCIKDVRTILEIFLFKKAFDVCFDFEIDFYPRRLFERRAFKVSLLSTLHTAH